MEILIHLPSGDELREAAFAIPTLLHLRMTEPRFVRVMQVMCGIMCADDAPDSLLEATVYEVRVLEEHAVRHQLALGMAAQAYVALFWHLHGERTKQVLEAHDAELRERYRMHGLHGMHKLNGKRKAEGVHGADVAGDANDDCLVCCGPVPAPGFTECSHGSRVCRQCADRLDRCPLCRKALAAALSPGQYTGPTSAPAEASARTGSPRTA